MKRNLYCRAGTKTVDITPDTFDAYLKPCLSAGAPQTAEAFCAEYKVKRMVLAENMQGGFDFWKFA